MGYKTSTKPDTPIQPSPGIYWVKKCQQLSPDVWFIGNWMIAKIIDVADYFCVYMIGDDEGYPWHSKSGWFCKVGPKIEPPDDLSDANPGAEST